MSKFETAKRAVCDLFSDNSQPAYETLSQLAELQMDIQERIAVLTEAANSKS